MPKNKKKVTAQELAQRKSTKEQEKQDRHSRIIEIAVTVLVVVIVMGWMITALSGCGVVNTEFTGTTKPAASDTQPVLDSTPAVGDGCTLETAKATHTVTIQIKDYGTIQAELYGNTAPATVENFVALANSGFYNGLTFHRIYPGFMIQGGDPNGNGTGSSSNTIPGEFSQNGFENNLLHLRGTISMARATNPNSASCQFFIVHEDSPHLDGAYAAFGKVTQGMDVVDAICSAAQPGYNGMISPEEQPVMESVLVTAL